MGFLQSGSKLLFRRKHREKESCLSQSHEDISNMGNNFAPPAAGIIRKKSGSFSRRLIKRFSFHSSGKSKGKATSSNGGANSVENWWWWRVAGAEGGIVVGRNQLEVDGWRAEHLSAGRVYKRMLLSENKPNAPSVQRSCVTTLLDQIADELYFLWGEWNELLTRMKEVTMTAQFEHKLLCLLKTDGGNNLK